MNYDVLTLEELVAKRLEILAQVAALQAEAVLVTAAHDAKAYAEKLAKKFGDLTQEELIALQNMLPKAQTMMTGDIESQAALGTPGE